MLKFSDFNRFKVRPSAKGSFTLTNKHNPSHEITFLTEPRNRPVIVTVKINGKVEKWGQFPQKMRFVDFARQMQAVLNELQK